ncbi:g6227 [Coccomyxa elongata]
MFVNLDEATFGGYKQANQILKNFNTEPKAMLTERFKDSIGINNYVNLVITTNEDFPVEITENDRRYFVLQCSQGIYVRRRDRLVPVATGIKHIPAH